MKPKDSWEEIMERHKKKEKEKQALLAKKAEKKSQWRLLDKRMQTLLMLEVKDKRRFMGVEVCMNNMLIF